MNDTLSITDLVILTPLGITDTERATPQKVLVTVEMEMDAKEVAREDDLNAGIDYAAVAEHIRMLAGTERKTMERLAEDIATMILERCEPASVRVTVKKFVLSDAADARITILRKR